MYTGTPPAPAPSESTKSDGAAAQSPVYKAGELKQSGMTRARAEALRTEYLRSKGLLHRGGGSSGGGGVWAGSIRYTGSKTDTAGSKEQTKLAGNQKGSSTQDKHRRNG